MHHHRRERTDVGLKCDQETDQAGQRSEKAPTVPDIGSRGRAHPQSRTAPAHLENYILARLDWHRMSMPGAIHANQTIGKVSAVKHQTQVNNYGGLMA